MTSWMRSGLYWSIGRIKVVRSSVFNLSFYGFTLLFGIAILPLLFLPGHRLLIAIAQSWAKGCLYLFEKVIGSTIEFRGLEHLPKKGPYLLAAKHQSEIDGIAILAKVSGVVTIAMQEMGRYPIIGRAMKKMRMILVNSEGGAATRDSLTVRASKAVSSKRPILIYPEGRLVPVGEPSEYKKAIYHLYDDFSLPVIPVATNVGLRWPQRKFVKKPGPAVIEFLPSIQPGQEKETFMSELKSTIEECSHQLLLEQK